MIDKRPMRDNVVPHSGAVRRLDGRPGRLPAGVPPAAVPGANATTEGLLPVLWRSRWLLAICIIVALSAGAVYIQTATPIYQSTAKLYLDHAAIRITSSYEPGARPQTERYLYTQAELIRSIPIIAVAADKLMTQGLRTFSEVDIPSAYLQKHLVVDVGKKDDTISVSFPSAYPVEAAAIVNQVVAAYVASRSEHGKTNFAQVLKIQQDDMQRTADELEKKRNELREFQKSGMPLALGSDQGGGVVMQRVLDIQSEYTRAETRMKEADAYRKSIRALTDDPAALRQYVRSRGSMALYSEAASERALLESRAVELELQRSTLAEILTSDHLRIVGLTVEIQQVKRSLAALDEGFVATVLAAAEQQYVEAKDYAESLATSYVQQRDQATKLSAEVAQYLWLEDEVERLTNRFATLDERVRDLSKVVGEDVNQLRMAILEPASTPEKPSEPRKGRMMAFALVFGSLLGGCIAVSRDWLNQTLRSADEISALLGVPVLGAVPGMSRRQKVRDRGQKVLLQPDSHEAEAFRTIRTAVFFGAPKEKAKTLLVTSPTAGDGKSTLVSNLATAIACAGQKTLVLDADFRKPMQHAIFELDCHERCLSEVLAGRIRLAAAIQPTGTKGLHVLTCGHGISNPAEILNGRTFTRLLKCLSAAYDRVVIDAPPVTLVTDAQILGALSDATVLVLKADRSTRRVAQRALDALQSVGAQLLGVVINEVHRTGDRYGYYYGQYRKYGSSDSGNGRAARSKGRPTADQPSRGLPLKMAFKRT